MRHAVARAWFAAVVCVWVIAPLGAQAPAGAAGAPQGPTGQSSTGQSPAGQAPPGGAPPGGGPPGLAPPPAQPGRAGARVDLTGYWVSVVSEDWRWRMITPPRGDYTNIPVTVEARRVADAWDWQKDETAGEQCKGYAAPAIMREPGRLHITWENDLTLKIETDAGQQTRLLRFGAAVATPAASAGERSWQGVSVAQWERAPQPAAGGGFGLGIGPRAGTNSRTLQVVTTRIRPGYLRKNGVPFSAEAVLTEYFDVFKGPADVDWFVVTSIVDDPQFLAGSWVTTSHFKKEPDASKWNPTSCKVR